MSSSSDKFYVVRIGESGPYLASGKSHTTLELASEEMWKVSQTRSTIAFDYEIVKVVAYTEVNLVIGGEEGNKDG